MVLDALQHAIPCLEFLCLLKNQSVFNFCAIPQVMALATLNECFNNPNVLVKNVKIRKSMACQMIMHAVNPNEAANMFRDNLRKMHQKCPSSDPNFAKLSILCGRVSAAIILFHQDSVDPRVTGRTMDRNSIPLLATTPIRLNTAR